VASPSAGDLAGSAVGEDRTSATGPTAPAPAVDRPESVPPRAAGVAGADVRDPDEITAAPAGSTLSGRDDSASPQPVPVDRVERDVLHSVRAALQRDPGLSAGRAIGDGEILYMYRDLRSQRKNRHLQPTVLAGEVAERLRGAPGRGGLF